jgi:hypothetical protein
MKGAIHAKRRETGVSEGIPGRSADRIGILWYEKVILEYSRYHANID